MFTKLLTISDLLAKLERAEAQEIKEPGDEIRKLNAYQMEIKIQEIIDQALQYIGMHEIQESTVEDLLVLIENRRSQDNGSKFRKKPGRKHLADDVWAWRQVNEADREQSEVYKEWIERPDVKSRNLLDPQIHFTRVIKPGWLPIK